MGEKLFVVWVNEFVQIRIILITQKGKVVDFVVQLELLEPPMPVVRYDFAHGFPHRDVYYRDGRKIKEEVYEHDLNVVVHMAVSDLKENWIQYLRRCGYEFEED